MVIGIPGCDHIVGSACLLQKVHGRRLPPDYIHRCPACDTDWYLQPSGVAPVDTKARWHRLATEAAERWRVDYATARYFFGGEESYADECLPQAFDILKENHNLVGEIEY